MKHPGKILRSRKVLLAIGILLFLVIALIVYPVLSSLENRTIESMPEIVAHRGGQEYEPESSLQAFTTSAKQGFPLEMDLRRLRDNTIVISHDSTTKRYLEGRSRKVNTLELFEWDGLCFKNPGTLELRECVHPITFDDVLTKLPHNYSMVPEIKDSEVSVSDLEALLRKYHKEKSPIETIRYKEAAQAAHDGFNTLYLLTPRHTIDFNQAKKDRISIVGVSQSFPRSMIQKAHDRGIKLWVWTVNNEKTAMDWASAGVDGIITDRPNAISAYLKAHLKK